MWNRQHRMGRQGEYRTRELSRRDSPGIRFEKDANVARSERALKFIYNAATETWDNTLINVIVQDAFAEGSMRTAHYMKDLTEISGEGKYVLKLFKDVSYNSQVSQIIRASIQAQKKILSTGSTRKYYQRDPD